MTDLTSKQLRVLRGLAAFMRRRRHPPSIRALADYLLANPATIYQHLLTLKTKGYVERREGKLRILRNPDEQVKCILCGHELAEEAGP